LKVSRRGETPQPNAERGPALSILLIILIVIVVLALLGFFGYSRR
jgi:flagellar basal body-associated protein FliL